MHVPVLISDLAYMLLVASVTTLLFKKLHQPLVLGYIIAGFLVGPYCNLFPNVTDMVSIQTWSEIGIIILMFYLGLEFNLHKLASVGGTAIITAITVVSSMLMIGFGCGRLLGWDTMNSIFLGGMVSMSSTMIIMKAFEDLMLKGKKFTELVLGTLIIEDIAAILMMVILSTIAVSQEISGTDLALTLSKMLLYLAAWMMLGIYLLPTIIRRIGKLMNEETLLIVSLGICLGMVLLATHLGFSSALGAFLAGSLLAGTTMAEEIEHISKPIKDLFGAVFFISVGMLVNPSLIVEYSGPILLITLATIIGQPFFSTIGVLISGQSLKTAVLSGSSLAQIGEFSFIIAALGVSLGVLYDYVYPIIVSVSVITTFLSPFMIRSSEGTYSFINRILPQRLANYLNRHTSETQFETEKDSEWIAFIRRYFFRLTISGVCMLIIILAMTSFFWPFLGNYLQPSLAAVVSSVITLTLMAPFISQSLVPKAEYFTSLWFKNTSNHLPLIALIILRLSVLVVLVMLPLRIMFSFSTLYILLAAVVVVFFILRSDWLITPYLKIEAQFLANLNERKLAERKDTNVGHCWLDEQIYVGKIVFTEKCPVVNKNLATLMTDMLGRRRSGLKIIKIIRHSKHINIPNKEDLILLGDTVFIAGSITELETFARFCQTKPKREENGTFATLRDFIKHQQEEYAETDQLLCYAITVNSDSQLAGLSIKNSYIKKEYDGFLLGLERNLLPIISPDIHMRLQENDLLWILSTQKMASRLARFEML
ncbi:MAG: cation:proton antiporter [Eubacteriales bacterium]